MIRSWPTDTFFGLLKDMFFNGEGIEIIHIPEGSIEGVLRGLNKIVGLSIPADKEEGVS